MDQGSPILRSGGLIAPESDARGSGRSRPGSDEPPGPPYRFVPRPRFHAAIEAITDGPARILVVWSAAGTGKSVLLGECARRLARSGHDVAWIADPTETDTAHDTGPDRNAATDTGTGLRILVVDDLHLLSPAEVDALFDRVRHEPRLRLLAAGRFQPGAGRTHLAATGELLELRTDDLAFTVEECEALALLHGVELPRSASAALTARTGGWATGLALAMPVLAGSADPVEQVERFTADNRAIGDYLTSEVLAACTREERDLLVTAAVDASVPLELVVELTGRPDAGAALALLSRTLTLVTESSVAALPSTPGGRGGAGGSGESDWCDSVSFHPVLLGFLQAEARLRDLGRARRDHATAARWFARTGDGDRALHQAIDSADTDLLRDLLDEFALPLVLSGHGSAVERAIRLVPPARRGLAETVAQLLVELPFADPYQSTALFLQAHTATASEPHSAWSTLLLALEVFAAGSAAEAEVLLTALASPEHVRSRAGCLGLELVAGGAEARVVLLRGDAPAALDRYRQVAESARRAGYDWLSLQISDISATAAITAGAWEEAAGIEDAMADMASRSSLSMLDRARAAATIVSAARDYQAGRPVPVAELDAIVAAESEGRVLGLGVPARTLTLLAALDADDNPRTDADDLEHLLRASGRRYPRLVAAALVRILSIRLELDGRTAARDLAEFAETVLGADSLEVQIARFLVDPPSGARDPREAALVAALDRRARSWHAGAIVSAWILLAAHAQATGRAGESDQRMLTAVAQAKRFRSTRPFLARGGEGARLLEPRLGRLGHLDPFAHTITDRARALSTPRGDHGSVPHLTGREHDILKELPAHQTLQAIARNQHLSANTVKTHVRSIYQKLGVTERSEAVARAQRLGLL